MVIEMVQFSPREGQEDALVEFLRTTRGVIEKAPACRSYTCGRGVEDPSKVFLLVGWDSLEGHQAATQNAEFQEWRQKLVGFNTGATMQHMAVAG